MRYTVRGIPDALDKKIRQRAREEGKSLNEMTLDVLAEGLEFGETTAENVPRRDLSDIVWSWKKKASFEAALAAQDAVDKDKDSWK